MSRFDFSSWVCFFGRVKDSRDVPHHTRLTLTHFCPLPSHHFFLISSFLSTENRINKNILTETTQGNDARTIVVGAHLDSVFEGPGISDNGSGCAGVLELALQLKKNQFDAPNSLVKNKLRFAFWGAEGKKAIHPSAQHIACLL
jgi:Peptidase family M28